MPFLAEFFTKEKEKDEYNGDKDQNYEERIDELQVTPAGKEDLDEEEDSDYCPIYSGYTSPKRLTISRVEVETNIDLDKLPKEAANIIHENMEFIKSLSSLREQICYVMDLLRPNGNQNALVSFSQIGTMFHLSKGAISSHYRREITKSECGNINKLNDQQINLLIDFAYEEYLNKNPVTYDYMLNFIYCQFNIVMLIKTLYKLIQRIPQLKTVDGRKMESDRVYCDPELIDYFYDKLEEILLQSIPSAFAINIDESGYIEWVDSQDIKVIVPFEHESNEIKIPVDKNCKRASMIAGI